MANNPALIGIQKAFTAKPPAKPPATSAVGTTPDGMPAAYQGPDQGPFECDNCQFFVEGNGCQRPEVLKDVGDPDGDGLADVDPHGCCNYFSKGDTDNG